MLLTFVKRETKEDTIRQLQELMEFSDAVYNADDKNSPVTLSIVFKPESMQP